MKGIEKMIPPLFTCPISLDLFKDPVTLCTGQTYDRSFIEKWLSSGNSTCPVTMQKLQDSSMVPNLTLRHLIDQWRNSNNQIEPNCFEFTDTHLSLAAIKEIIESMESTLEGKLQVLEKVQSLSQELPLKNYCLIQLDFFGALLELVLRNAESLDFQEKMGLLEKAIDCALKLMPFSDLATLNYIFKDESKYESFLFLFEKGSIYIKKNLCLLVEAIASSLETRPLCKKFGKSVKLIQEIVHLVEVKSETFEGGIRAISGLSLIESNFENLAKNGVVQGLVAFLESSENRKLSLAAMAMNVIEKLLEVESGKEALMNEACGVDALVKMVFRISDHDGSESALNSLMIVCCDSESLREEAILCGVLTQLLLLLQSQCSARNKTKARMLMKMLRTT